MRDKVREMRDEESGRKEEWRGPRRDAKHKRGMGIKKKDFRGEEERTLSIEQDRVHTWK